jgi:hypothetical protein
MWETAYAFWWVPASELEWAGVLEPLSAIEMGLSWDWVLVEEVSEEMQDSE